MDDDDQLKFCRKCGLAKPLSEFHIARGTRDGHRGECKACFRILRKAYYRANKAAAIERARQWQQRNPERHKAYLKAYRERPDRKRAMRDRYYRLTFGMTANEFDSLLASQGGVCKICGERPDREASMHVDHDHATGEVRGILCSRCNHAIGLFREDPALLEAAAAYLRR